MPTDEKFDKEETVILKGPNEARKIRMHQPDETLSSTDLAGKYHDVADGCEKQGKYVAADKFRRKAFGFSTGRRSSSKSNPPCPTGGRSFRRFLEDVRSEDSSSHASILASDADGWAAYAYGLCHSGTPVENIEFEMKRMAADTASSYGLRYFNSSIAPAIATAEKEAAKYEYRSDVVVALIAGYKALIKGYTESRSYFMAKLNITDDPKNNELKPFTQRIKEHADRIRQLEKMVRK